MAQAVVMIAGRTYRMNCDEGEEAHIESLARLVDSKIDELRGAFGEIGDQRITVMAALTVADELVTTRKKLAAEAEATARAREETEQLRLRLDESAAWAAAALEDAAAEVEAATRALNEEGS
ncbi:cell division protein ZapA [Rhodoblastus sp.]|jgi:cell division protein ZapA|uniref:cell division protein ZapA n=1 Tax=Rhodoblastus sp. TaxID=1962975 RepID=UPI0025FDA66D|nr:cell division protein ZapA [Rhodoblastus sp.]